MVRFKFLVRVAFFRHQICHICTRLIWYQEESDSIDPSYDTA